MSKLFPVFNKKKGKGKDDDVIEEESPRIKGKRERVKEALMGSSLSPSKSNKHKKKAKAAKEKKAVNGKVAECLPEDAEFHPIEDFYIDDDGAVKPGNQEEDRSFVDEVMSSVDESFTLDYEKPFTLEHEKSLSQLDKEEEAPVSPSHKVEEKEIKEENPFMSENGPEVERDTNCYFIGDADSEAASDVEINVIPEEPEPEEPIPPLSPVSEVVEGGHRNHLESGIDSHESNFSNDKEAEVLTEKENNIVDHSLTDNLDKEMNSDADRSFTSESCKHSGDLSVPVSKEEVEVGSLSEERTSFASAFGESQFSHNDAAKNTDDEAEDLQDESAEKPQSENVASSQDSDDDFDSAQEDWDDDDSALAKNLVADAKNNSESSQDLQSPIINEAKNEALVDRESELPEQFRNRCPSEYEDASGVTLNDSNLLEETSDDRTPSASEENRKAKRISGPEKLVRKLSNISAASSDAFNEELDDLLDEELDRLSEEEEAGADSNADQKSENVNLKDSIDSGVVDHVDVKIIAENDDSTSTNINNSEVCGDEKSEFDDKEVKGDNDINADSSEQTPVINADKEQATTDSVVEQNDSEVKEGSTLGSHVSTSEDNSDQVKDSGYYSLPVSPNPGAIVRAAAEEERVVKKADDSFGDSEEEGMITPTSEASTIEDKTENSNKEVDAMEDDDQRLSPVCDSNVVPQKAEESNLPSESKNEESNLPSEPKNDSDVADSAPPQPSPKQGASLKVVIPNPIEKEREGDITSPKCLSPTKIRHRSPLKETDESFVKDPIGDRFLEQAVLMSHEEGEARLAQRRAARAEARELRLRELEKQQHDQENDEEKQFSTPAFAEPSPRPAVTSRPSVGRTAALNSTGQYSRRSSEDSTTDESALPANVREMRAELKELDDKFRKAMITNAQLDNEKSTLTYEVELIKDKYTELEETHTQLTKEHRRKCTEYEQLRKVSTKLQEEVKILRGMLQERDQLIQEYGLVVVGEEEDENGEVPPDPDEFDDMDDLSPRKIAIKKVLLSQEAAELLGKGAARGSLDVRLKKFGEEKIDLEDQVRRLKLELEEERSNSRRRENGLDYEKAKEQSKTLNEYKFRIQKAEAEVLTLQANVARLDALSTRYKTQSEELEKSEEELKLERRKLQRELREAQSRLEELETTNSHLIRRFDKLKNARSTLLKDLSQEPA